MHCSHELFISHELSICIVKYVCVSQIMHHVSIGRVTASKWCGQLCVLFIWISHNLFLSHTKYVSFVSHELCIMSQVTASKWCGQLWVYGNSFESYVVAIVVPDMEVLSRCVTNYTYESRTTHIHHDSHTSLLTSYSGVWYGGLFEVRHICI